MEWHDTRREYGDGQMKNGVLRTDESGEGVQKQAYSSSLAQLSTVAARLSTSSLSSTQSIFRRRISLLPLANISVACHDGPDPLTCLRSFVSFLREENRLRK